MSGKELLEGMSYVDDQYIEEAEKQFIRPKIRHRWVRWASLAACVCIGFLGMLAVNKIGEYPAWHPEKNMMQKEDFEVLEENKLTGSNGPAEGNGFVDDIETAETFGIVEDIQIAESITELERAEASQSVKNEAEIQEDEIAFTALLLVDSMTENGFRGIVAEAAEGTSLVTGMEVKVVLQNTVRGENQSDQSVPKQETAALAMDELSGSLVEVSVISYDEETATVVVKEIKGVE